MSIIILYFSQTDWLPSPMNSPPNTLPWDYYAHWNVHLYQSILTYYVNAHLHIKSIDTCLFNQDITINNYLKGRYHSWLGEKS